MDSLNNFLDADVAGSALNVRRKRTEDIQRLVSAGDFRGVVGLLARTHDNKSDDYIMGALLNGRDPAKEKRLRKLRMSTDTSYVPAYFQSASDESEDVFSTIFHAADGRMGLSTHEENAIKDIMKWCDDYEKYWENLTEISLKGSEAKVIIDFIDEQRAKGIDFPTSLDIPYLSKNGDSYTDEKPFPTEEELDLFYEARVADHKRSFSMGARDDYYNAGDTYDEFFMQAVRFRRLELVYKRLMMVGSRSLDESQQEVLERITKLFTERPDLRPRSLEVAKLQNMEIKAEKKARSRFWRSRSHKDKYPLPKSVKDIRNKVSPGAVFARVLGYLSIPALYTATSGILTPMFEELPEVQYFLASLENYRNDMLYGVFGMTPALSTCARADRAWTINEVAMNNYVMSHTSRFVYLSRIDESYDYTQDKPLAKLEHDIRVRCVKERSEYRLAEHHKRNKDAIPFAVREVVDSYFLETLMVEEGVDKEILTQVEEILFFNWVEEDEVKMNTALDKFTAQNPDLGGVLQEYLNNVDNAVDIMDKYGRLPYYEDLNSLIRAIDKDADQ
jgi:hypothetical protein